MALRLHSFEIENLRGFQRALLGLRRSSTVLVGPNNSGKTSILLLLHWLLNEVDESLLRGHRSLTASECQLLVPARSTGNRARRLTLRVRVTDGRQRKRFRCIGDIAILRLDQRQHPTPQVRLRIGSPRRGDKFDTDEIALSLLAQLRREIAFLHVPSSRDAASARFQATLATALTERLAQRAVHQTQGGAPAEYREVNRALKAIADVAKRLADPLWVDMQQEIVPGMSRTASFTLSATPRDLVEWVAQRMRFGLTTGDHDVQSVEPTHVGSGLQSLLDLAVLKGAAEAEGRMAVLAVEEPEAFLHPAAQRALARKLFDDSQARIVISTHSPVIVEESNSSDVVLVRDHRIYEPRVPTDATRNAINTALMTGLGAEMAFAESVLVVEGEGDRLFFDVLRRRVSEFDTLGFTHKCFAVAAGSNSSFAPWLRLLSSYGDDASRPIEWLVVADGDSTRTIRRAYRDAQMTLSTSTRAEMRSLELAFSANDRSAAIGAARRLNRSAATAAERLFLLPVDLEWCAISDAKPSTVQSLSRAFATQHDSVEEMAGYLGSKCMSLRSPSSGVKAPWMRAFAAAELPWDEVSSDAKAVLRRWLLAASRPRDVDALLQRAR